MIIVWPDNFPFMAGGQGPDEFTFPGSTEEVTVSEPVIRPLKDFVNRVMEDVDTGFVGILTHRFGRRGDIYTLYNPETGRSYNIRRGRTLFDPTTRALTSIGRSFLDTRTTTASQADINRLGLATAGGGTGGGVSADTAADIASREAIAAANRAHEIELERLRAARENELARIQEENANKRAKLNEAGALARTAAEVKQRAGEWLARTVGSDSFRAGTGAQGGVSRGTTPAEYFRGQWQNIADQPIPTVDESAAIPEIQKQINTLQGMQQEPIMPTFGFAQGGQLTTGYSGVSGQSGSTKRGVLTGERNMDGDEEVVVMDAANPGRVEVIPLVSHAAQGGLFDVSSLAPVFGSLGFTGDMPSVGRDQSGFYSRPQQTRSGFAQGGDVVRRLGYGPRFLRRIDTGETYYRTPEGRLRHITDPNLFGGQGLRWSDVLNVAGEELGNFGQLGEPMTGLPPAVEQGAGIRPRSIPLVTTPEYGSVLLPDVSALAGIWKFLDPQTRTAVASAYGTAGLGGGPGDPLANALNEINQAVRRGSVVGSYSGASGGRLG